MEKTKNTSPALRTPYHAAYGKEHIDTICQKIQERAAQFSRNRIPPAKLN